MCHLRQGHGKICVIYDGLRKVYSLKIKLLMPSQTRAVCLLVSPAGFDRAYKTCRGRSASTWSVHEGVKTYLFYGFHMGTNNLFGQPARLKIIRSLKIKRELGRVNNHCLCFWMKSWSKKCFMVIWVLRWLAKFLALPDARGLSRSEYCSNVQLLLRKLKLFTVMTKYLQLPTGCFVA